MWRSPASVLDDKVTKQQFAILQNAKFTDARVSKVKSLKDVFHMSLINQDQLFGVWITQYDKKSKKYAEDVGKDLIIFVGPGKIFRPCPRRGLRPG